MMGWVAESLFWGWDKGMKEAVALCIYLLPLLGQHVEPRSDCLEGIGSLLSCLSSRSRWRC